MIPFAHKSARATSLSRPATADSSFTPTVGSQRRNRGSILGVASDALRFGRRRKSIKELPPPPPPRLLLPDVIEVRASAHTPTLDEDEEAEREQLRAAAVQSVGFDVNISRPPADREHPFGDHGDGDGDHISQKEDHEHGNGRALPSIHLPNPPPAADSSPSDARSRGRLSSPAVLKSVQPTSTPTTMTTAPNELVAFPSTRAQLAALEQLSATLPKHYPPPSLLMLALSKQWRARHVVLSAPVLAGASYLHIFKSNAPDEREMERLEINERSVVFVNDEDVGGRRGVVRVGGLDVGALRRDLNGEENGMTMMMLQIVDANESQNWINAIKNAVLGQRCAFTWPLFPLATFLMILSCRSVRAGLGIPSTSSSVPEPRGDLDVMLSMRMQGMLHSPIKASFNPSDDASKAEQNGSSEETSTTPRPPSLRSRPSSPRSPSGVLSLKSLFSVSGSGPTRPRSPSLARTTSPDVASGESFSSAASSLLGMRTVTDSPLIKPYSMLPPTGPALDPAAQIQRKIIDPPQPNLDWAPLENSTKPPLSMPPPPRPMSPSLNPPPLRRRAYTTNEQHQAPSSPASGQLVYNHGNASTAGSFGVPVPETTRPPMERAWSDRGKPRANSVSSNSTTAENGSVRRWSRQSSNLPPRPTPPPEDSATPVSTVPHPPPWQNSGLPLYDSERSPSRTSSQSQKTLPSIISSLHVASKRTSTSSSVYSIATTSSSAFSKARALGGSHRLSMPPPRPAPSTALPPTPTGSDTEGTATAPPPTVKPMRRNSLARRALRLSLGQPAPAQGQGLNDGHPNTAPVSRSHSRSTSVDSVPHSSLSHGHTVSPSLLVPPNPPPTGPLPPPPPVTPTPIHAPLPTIPRTTTLKQRLRILSAPSGRSTPPPAPTITTVIHPNLPPLEIPTCISPIPICEPIARIGPDADFLHLDGETPIATVPPKTALRAALKEDEIDDNPPLLSLLSFPPPPPLPSHRPYRRSLPPPPDRSPQQMTVLSPPPRKGSIRPLPSPSPEQERGQSATRDDEEMLPLTPPPLDLARNTSTLSLSIVSGAV